MEKMKALEKEKHEEMKYLRAKKERLESRIKYWEPKVKAIQKRKKMIVRFK